MPLKMTIAQKVKRTTTTTRKLIIIFEQTGTTEGAYKLQRSTNKNMLEL